MSQTGCSASRKKKTRQSGCESYLLLISTANVLGRKKTMTPSDFHRSIESFMDHKFTMGYIVRVECGVGSIWKWSPVNLISPSISPIMSVIHGPWATGAAV